MKASGMQDGELPQVISFPSKPYVSGIGTQRRSGTDVEAQVACLDGMVSLEKLFVVPYEKSHLKSQNWTSSHLPPGVLTDWN